MGIAFLPIDLDYKLPDETDFLNYLDSIPELVIKNDKVSKVSYWKKYLVCSTLSPEEFNDLESIMQFMKVKSVYTGKPLHIYNQIDKKYPDLIPAIKSLPLKEISLAFFLRQVTEVELHQDIEEDEVYDADIIKPNDSNGIWLEPKRYNILMTKHNYKSFYFSPDCTGSTKCYPQITRDSPAFALSNNQFWHGANYVGPDKVQLLIIGAIDVQKHQAFIKQQYNKYKNSGRIIEFKND